MMRIEMDPREALRAGLGLLALALALGALVWVMGRFQGYRLVDLGDGTVVLMRMANDNPGADAPPTEQMEME